MGLPTWKLRDETRPRGNHAKRHRRAYRSSLIDLDDAADLYVANGHLSGESATDDCTRFWCHDIYVGHRPTPGFQDLFQPGRYEITLDSNSAGGALAVYDQRMRRLRE